MARDFISETTCQTSAMQKKLTEKGSDLIHLTFLVKLAKSTYCSWIGIGQDVLAWALGQVPFQCLVHSGHSINVWWAEQIPPSSLISPGTSLSWEQKRVEEGEAPVMWRVLGLSVPSPKTQIWSWRGGPSQQRAFLMTFQLIDLTLVGRVPEAEKDERHWRGKALMSLQSCSDLERFFFRNFIS